MIEFDDAGIGCPILGELFVARRVETNEMVVRFVSVEEKQHTHLSMILLKMLQQLKGRKEEEIFICRGHVFHNFARNLEKSGYKVKRGVIRSITNDIAEDSFLEALRNIGLPKSIIVHKRDFARFHQEVMLWYSTFYKGQNIIKKKKKLTQLDFVMNRVCHHPNLVAQLFEMNKEEVCS